MKYISVRNWSEFQQYKDRDPKWIKFYRDVLDDYEIEQLSEISQLHLFKIWLLAAKHSNKIPNDPKWIAKKIGAKSKVDIKQLVTAGFLDVYDNVQPCTETYLETEEEREVEAEVEKKERARRTRLPAEWEPTEKLINYCRDKRPDLDPAITFENFKDYYLSHGKVMADWGLTAMRWIRNERSTPARQSTNRPVVRETAHERSQRIIRERADEIAKSL